MYVKIMSGENKPDRDADKTYQLIECKRAEFVRCPDTAEKRVWIDGESHHITGNVYILNNAGKTVDSFWPSDMVRPAAQPAPTPN